MCTLLKSYQCKEIDKKCNPKTGRCIKKEHEICQCNTRKGTRCSRYAIDNSIYCLQHQDCKTEDVQDKECQFKFPTYDKNSCYLDVTLVALLYHNTFIYNEILNKEIPKKNKIASRIHNYLVKIYNRLGTEDITKYRKKLRYYLQKYSETTDEPKKFTCDQLEPSDVISLLMTLYDVNILVKTSSYVQKTKQSKWISVSENVILMNPVILVNVQDPEFNSDLDTYLYYQKSEFEPENYFLHQGHKYKYRHQLTSYEDAPFLWVNIRRLYFGNIPDLRVVKIPEKIDRKKLRIIIIHSGGAHGGHYTLYFKCKRKWYFYDDTQPKIKFIGVFSDLPKRVFTHSTDLVYS